MANYRTGCREGGHRMSMAIIANPLADEDGEGTAEKVEQILTDRRIDFEMMYTEYHRHGIELHKASKTMSSLLL